MSTFAGVAAAPQLAGVDVRDVLPAGRTAAAEGCSMPRPRGGRVAARRQCAPRRQQRRRGRRPGRCLHFGQSKGRKCSWRPHPTRTVLVLNVGAHWVTLCMDERFVLYLDSYCLPPGLPVVREFIARCARGLGLDPSEGVFYSTRQVQAWPSNFCGLFTVLWTLALGMTTTSTMDINNEEGESFVNSGALKRSAVEATKIKFYRKPSLLKSNDKKCLKYLQHLAEANLDIDERYSSSSSKAGQG